MSSTKNFLSKLPENYIYISHLGEDGKYFIIPTWPEQLQDTMSSTFQSENALGRSAPVWTYSYSGPRNVVINIHLHRDMMNDYNLNISNVKVEKIDDDYVDTLIKALQSISVPKYNLESGSKSVEPPMVAVRFGDELFIRGIVNGSISVTYSGAIQDNNKHAEVTVGFGITETDPYDATSIAKNGSFRGLTRSMKAGFGYEE